MDFSRKFRGGKRRDTHPEREGGCRVNVFAGKEGGPDESIMMLARLTPCTCHTPLFVVGAGDFPFRTFCAEWWFGLGLRKPVRGAGPVSCGSGGVVLAGRLLPYADLCYFLFFSGLAKKIKTLMMSYAKRWCTPSGVSFVGNEPRHGVCLYLSFLGLGLPNRQGTLPSQTDEFHCRVLWTSVICVDGHPTLF